MNGFEGRFRGLWKIGAIVTSTGPLALWVTTGTVPPWPKGSGAVASLFCGLAVICVYSIGSARRRPSRLLWEKISGSALILLGLIGVLGYLYLDAKYVVEFEQELGGGEVGRLRFVVGDVLLPGTPDERPEVLLPNNAYDPFAVWTKDSVIKGQLLVAGSFLLTFMMLSSGMAVLSLRPATESEEAAKAEEATEPGEAEGEPPEAGSRAEEGSTEPQTHRGGGSDQDSSANGGGR